MEKWVLLSRFCEERGYDPKKVRRHFKSIIRDAKIDLEIDVSRIDELKDKKSKSLVRRPKRKAWELDSPKQIVHIVKLKMNVKIDMTEELDITIVSMKKTKDPIQKKILKDEAQKLKAGLQRNDAEIDLCNNRVNELLGIELK